LKYKNKNKELKQL